MTTTLHERLQEALQRVSDHGGLPGFADLEKFRAAFLDFEDTLEEYSGDAVAVSNAWGDDVPVPFKIEAEHIAVLGLLVTEMRPWLIDLERLVDEIGSSLYGIDRARSAQEAADDA